MPPRNSIPSPSSRSRTAFDVVDRQRDHRAARRELEPERVGLHDRQREVAGLELGGGHLAPGLDERQAERLAVELGGRDVVTGLERDEVDAGTKVSGMRGTIRGMTVRLEPWGEDDLPLLQALLGDPVMMEHLGGPEAPEKIVERHHRYLGFPACFKITLDGVGAGWVGYWEHEWQGELIYEMGWSVLPGFQGRGIAAEGTRLALEAARASDGPRTSTPSRRPRTARRTRSAASWASRCSGRSSSSSRRGTSARATTGSTTSARRRAS